MAKENSDMFCFQFMARSFVVACLFVDCLLKGAVSHEVVYTFV